MADSDVETFWPEHRGELSWVEREGRFQGVRIGDTFHAFDELDLEQFEPKMHKGSCPEASCLSPFPSEFTGCPNCGAELVSMFAASDEPWSYPGPDGDGLLNTERIEIVSVSEPLPPMAAPLAANFTLVIAGTPRRLLAIDREAPAVSVFNRETETWRDISSPIAFDTRLPRTSWSVAVFDDRFAIAGREALLVVKLDRLGTDLDIVRAPKRVGMAVTGPIRMSDKLVFLTTIDGSLSVVSHNPRDGSWSKECDVTGVPEGQGEAFLAAPVSKGFNAFWAGATGYVGLRAGAGKWEASWSPWSPDFVPELQVRPIWTRNAFWQLGSRHGNSAFQELARGRQGGVHDEISGPHLTAGECSFASGMIICVTPWEPALTQTVLSNNDSFLLPIIGLKGLDALVADCSPRLNPGELLQPGAIAQLAALKLYRSGGGGPLLDLRLSIPVADATQLQAVVFDDRLFVYDSRNKCIHAWKFQRK
jgi:hypothetical protein